MRRLPFLLLIVVIFGVLVFGPAQAQFTRPTGVEIASPRPGEAVQGVIPIVGSTFAEGFQSWKLSFGYTQGETESWFLIAEQTNIIRDDVLAEWDTSMITDGVYDLRLTVRLKNDDLAETIVEGVRVRNYTAIETNTPPPTSTAVPTQTIMPPTATASSTPTETLTLTPLPTNPVEISQRNITNSLSSGVIITTVSFLLMGLYLSIRKTIQ